VYNTSDNIIKNIIVYDGVSEYSLTDGFALEEINEEEASKIGLNIGDERTGKGKYKDLTISEPVIKPE
jgi:hypothetical protein